MNYEAERLKIIETCKLMQHLGFFLGTWGNVSIRIGDKIMLTPSKINYDTMQPEDMVIIDLDGNKLEGHRVPTSEKEVHRQIYKRRPDVGAVIHAHTAKCMSVSTIEVKEVPCLVEEMSQLLGGSIPLASSYVPAEQHEKLGEAAANAIGDKSGCILRNHGPVACGRDLDEAVLVSKVMEKACGIFLDISSAYHIKPIQPCYVNSERYRFLNTYGKENT